MHKFLLLSLYCLIFHSSYSQCDITIVGAPCLGTNLQFFCNSNNGTEHYWKFDSDDSLKLNCNTDRAFSSPGLKRITLMVKDALGNTCIDTAYISIRSVSAHMSLWQSRPICTTIIEMFDSSNIYQPFDGEQDSIIRWTYEWFENGKKSEKIFNDSLPGNFIAKFNHNGYHPISLKTETKYGCESSESQMIYIPGPIAYFDTFIPHQHCTRDEIGFNNMSLYNQYDSCIWLWDFGDNQFANQYDTFTNKDTIWHHYENKGQYHVTLNLYYSTISGGGNRRHCHQIFPDTTGLSIDPVKLIINDCGPSSVLKTDGTNILNIYPNPANQVLQITGADEIEIYIINTYGSIVHHFYNKSNQVTEIGNIPEGLYLLTDGHFRVLSKLMIKR